MTRAYLALVIVVATASCAMSAPTRVDAPPVASTEPAPLVVVVKQVEPWPGAKPCVVDVPLSSDKASTQPPALVTGTSDDALDAACLDRAREWQSQTALPIELVSLHIKHTFWVGGTRAGGAGGVADVSALTVRGGLSKREIKGQIDARLIDIKRCYEVDLHSKPDLAGRLLTSFVIDPAGSVAGAALILHAPERPMQGVVVSDGDGDPNDDVSLALGRDDPKLGQCVLDVIRGMKFPSPKGGGIVFVRYPFHFSSSGG